MFDSDQISALAQKHSEALRTLDTIRTTLEEEFDGLKDAILALLLSVASGEPLILIGPPGTAKSRLIRRFCTLVGIETEKEGGGYFEYLLTPFTVPSELWGEYNPKSLLEGKLERIGEEVMMQNARVVLLEEVFNGSSAILNSLLTFMNERVFYDRGRRRHVKLECLFAATNELPDSPQLRAVADRFALRCRVDNVEADIPSIDALLRKAWPLTYGPDKNGLGHPHLLDGLDALRKSIRNAASIFCPDQAVTALLAQRVQTAREYGLSRISNRRLVKCVYVMLIHRILKKATNPDSDPVGQVQDRWTDELRLLPKYFLDDDTNEAAIAQMDAALDLL